MTAERIHVLELMGFDWNIDGHLCSKRGLLPWGWDERFGELKAYFELHGDCKVPSGSSLERWCMYQREEYRKWKRGERSSMTKTKWKALESVNFDFDPKAKNFFIRIQNLKDYKKKQGDSWVRWTMPFLECALTLVICPSNCYLLLFGFTRNRYIILQTQSNTKKVKNMSFCHHWMSMCMGLPSFDDCMSCKTLKTFMDIVTFLKNMSQINH